MGKSQRVKGATFEREIAGYLSERLGRVVKRKLEQARDGGDDIQVGRFRIECKRRKRLGFYAWMDQALAACASGDIPVVIARGDGHDAVALIFLDDLTPLIAGELSERTTSQGEPQ